MQIIVVVEMGSKLPGKEKKKKAKEENSGYTQEGRRVRAGTVLSRA